MSKIMNTYEIPARTRLTAGTCCAVSLGCWPSVRVSSLSKAHWRPGQDAKPIFPMVFIAEWILISVSQIVFFGKCVSSDGFEKCVSLQIVAGSQASLISTAHKLKYQSWIWVVQLLLQMGLMLLGTFTQCCCKWKELLSWKRALIEEITWDCTGFCKIDSCWGKALLASFLLVYGQILKV